MMPRAQAEQDAGGRQRDRFMTEPEDMKLWTNDLNQRAKAKSLHPFLLESAHGDGATDEQEAAYAQQVTMAKRMLRKEKYSADEMKMSTNEGQALVNTQMEMMDSQAIQLITDYCTAEQRTYLLDFQKASGKFAAMQSFFGGEGWRYLIGRRCASDNHFESLRQRRRGAFCYSSHTTFA